LLILPVALASTVEKLSSRPYRLWQDAYHNGISGREELRALPLLNVRRLRLYYKESKKKTNAFGNRFKYRANSAAAGC
jgi:hypothetical protein